MMLANEHGYDYGPPGSGGRLGFFPGFEAVVSWGAGKVADAIKGGGSAITYNASASDVANVLPQMDARERADLADAFARANRGQAIPWNDPGAIALAISGGTDGKVSSEEGKYLVAVWDGIRLRYGLPAPAYVTPTVDWQAPLSDIIDAAQDRYFTPLPQGPGAVASVSRYPSWVPWAAGAALLLLLRR